MTIILNPVLAACMGDAYGFPREYRKDDFRPTNTGEFYEPHPTHKDVKHGHFSDDGQMTSINGDIIFEHAESMLKGNFPSLKIISLAYVNGYMRDPRAGYSKGMLKAIKIADATGEYLFNVCDQFGRSEKSGAPMRASVFGLFPNIENVRSFASLQGSLTHSGKALVAAEAAALAAHYMLYNLGPRSNLPSFLATTLNDDIWLKPWKGKGRVGSPGMSSTRAAIWAIVRATSLKDLLIRACHHGGDVDTVACIALAAAWAYPCLPNDIPDKLYDEMENGPYGRDYAFDLGQKLLHTFQPPLRQAA